MLLARMPKRSYYDLLRLLSYSLGELQSVSSKAWATPPDRYAASVRYENLHSAYDVLKVLEDDLTLSDDDLAVDADEDGCD